MKIRYCGFGVVALAYCVSSVASAATITVTNDNDVVNGDKSSIANLVTNNGGDGISLREAIQAANNAGGNDAIQFTSGRAGSTITVGSALYVSESLTITCPGADQLTISGGGTTRVMRIDSSPAADSYALCGLAIADGNDIQSAGVVCFLSQDADILNISGCVFTNNRASTASIGSALGVTGSANARGTLTMTDCAVINNLTGQGTVFLHGVHATISNTTLSGNGSTFGTIWTRTTPSGNVGSLSLTNVTIAGNANDAVYIFSRGCGGKFDAPVPELHLCR